MSDVARAMEKKKQKRMRARVMRVTYVVNVYEWLRLLRCHQDCFAPAACRKRATFMPSAGVVVCELPEC